MPYLRGLKKGYQPFSEIIFNNLSDTNYGNNLLSIIPFYSVKKTGQAPL